jgi:hypothetical protein
VEGGVNAKLGLFSKNPIFKEPDIDLIEKKYNHFYTILFNKLSQIETVSGRVAAIGEETAYLSLIDLTATNMLLNNCNIETINSKGFAFIIERISFQVAEIFIYLSKRMTPEDAARLALISIESSVNKIREINQINIGERLRKDRLMQTIAESANMYANRSFNLADLCCDRCFYECSKSKNSYFLFKAQLNCVIVSSSYFLNTLILPLILNEDRQQPNDYILQSTF